MRVTLIVDCYRCSQVVPATKAGTVHSDLQVAMVALEARETAADLGHLGGRAPKDGSDRLDGKACLECQASRDSEVYWILATVFSCVRCAQKKGHILFSFSFLFLFRKH